MRFRVPRQRGHCLYSTNVSHCGQVKFVALSSTSFNLLQAGHISSLLPDVTSCCRRLDTVLDGMSSIAEYYSGRFVFTSDFPQESLTFAQGAAAGLIDIMFFIISC